jgi:phospholipase/carboxylesterase
MNRHRLPILLLSLLFSYTSVNAASSYVEQVVDRHRCLMKDTDQMTAETPLVLVIHGFGGNEKNLVPFWEKLRFDHCRAVFPEALYQVPKEKGGGYAWYHILFSNNREDIVASRKHLDKVIQHYLADMPGKGHPVVLMGFSQGGVMSLETGLNYDGKLAAIVSMSGYMPEPSKTLKSPEAPVSTPILLVHGIQDSVVPISMARQVNDILLAAGFHPLLKEFTMNHEITSQSLRTVRDFLKRYLAPYAP